MGKCYSKDSAPVYPMKSQRSMCRFVNLMQNNRIEEIDGHLWPMPTSMIQVGWFGLDDSASQ